MELTFPPSHSQPFVRSLYSERQSNGKMAIYQHVVYSPWTFITCSIECPGRDCIRSSNIKTVDCITQVEGYAQGCPLSAVFASLVLGELLLSLNIDLKD
eukprot:11167973-Ditylum_brightwellii.AAC.1